MPHTRTRRRIAGHTAAFLILTLIAAPGPAHADEQQAEQILDRLADHYATIDDLSYDLRLYSAHRQDGQEQEQDIRIDVKLQRPNKVALDLRDAAADEPDEDPALQLRADGETVNAYQPRANRYSSHEAPGDFDALARSQTLMQLSQGAIEIAVAPMTDQPLGDLIDQAPGREYVGEREFEGEAHDVVRLDTGEQVALDLYLTTGDEPRLRRIDVDFSEMLAMAEQLGQDIEAEAFIEFNNWQPNAGIDNGAFEFTPPADAEEVTPQPQATPQPQP